MPLTAVQREHLERRLVDERARALRLLNGLGVDHASSSRQDAGGDLSLAPLHPADAGTDTIDEELEASNATRVSKELVEIDAALQRLYHSPERFGMNEATGTEIPFERLDLIPWAHS